MCIVGEWEGGLVRPEWSVSACSGSGNRLHVAEEAKAQPNRTIFGQFRRVGVSLALENRISLCAGDARLPWNP